MKPLFVNPELSFEKSAAEVDLSEDPNQWPQEVLQELFKQVPYIADFQPHVNMQRVDSERGYGLGEVTLANKSEAQMGTDPAMMEAAGIRSVRIPVVIKEKRLSPFDLLVNDSSKVLPLTESRLRQALFRPQAFDVTSQTPGDQSMIGQLYPPYRQNYGFGGGGVSMGSGMGKQSSVLEEFLIAELDSKDPGFRRLPPPKEEKLASAKPAVKLRKTASLLSATFATFNRSDIDVFFERLSQDMPLQVAFQKNAHATVPALGILANNEPVSLEKQAAALRSALKPSVVQLTKTASGYLMKTASHRYWAPSVTPLNRRELIQQFGEKVALAADEAGQVTISEGNAPAPDAGTMLENEEPTPISKPGFYKVVDEESGNELLGFVVPNLLDVDGTPLPLAMFTNGSVSCVQPDILGIVAAGSGTLPEGPVEGAGAFFSYTSTGLLQATIPLVLSGGSYSSPGEPATLSGETFDGRPVEVSVQPNIQTIVQTPEGKVLVPESWKWTPLGASKVCALVGLEDPENDAPEDWHESADEAVPEDMEDNQPEEEAKESHFWVRGAEDCFTFSGPAVEKLSSAETRMVTLDDAMFLMAGLGVHQGYGTQKLAHSLNAPQKVQVGRLIKTASEQDAAARHRAARFLSLVPNLRQDLMKEAAAIPDPTAVDSVLSLGFINPENLMTFVSYLPSLEDTQNKLCDLLLSSRLGLADLQTSALERAVRSVEETIEGLKVIAFQGS